jgi:glycosyltransferase involved in cell wall biosynthesis
VAVDDGSTAEALRVIWDPRRRGAHGIGRFAAELGRRLEADPRVALEPLGLTTDWRSPWDAWRLGRVLRELGTSPAPASKTVFLSPGFSVPAGHIPEVQVLVTVHDLIHLRWGSVGVRAWYEAVLRPALRRAAAVLTVSQYSAEAVRRWAGLPSERVHVVGNGVSEAFGPGGEGVDWPRPYALWVGSDRPHKGLATLRAAWWRSGLGADHDLVLVVDGRAVVDREGAALGDLEQPDASPPAPGGGSASASVGEITDEQLACWYRGALAVAMPSLDEGFGLPAAEAAACGTAVVASRAGALPEVLGEEGAAWVRPGDVADWTGALRRVVEGVALRNRLAAGGPAAVARYRWDAVARRVIEVVRGVAG